MSLIAGVVWNDAGFLDREALEKELARTLSRNPDDNVLQFRTADALLFKVDVGAYDEPGNHQGVDGSVTLIAGNPLLPVGSGVAGRSAATELLACAIKGSRHEVFRAARGVFAGAQFDCESHSLSLFSDRLGVRPMYYAVTSLYTVFSTALRVLESLDIAGRAVDLEGVTEIISLGFPLGTRTAYAHIRAIDAAEIVRIRGQSVSHSHYWKWSDIAEAPASELPDLQNALYEAFNTAVQLRIGSDRTTAAFLSGGLDSRCVVASLANFGIDVNTFMFASRIGEEEFCATEFARKIGVRHHIVPGSTWPPQWAQMIANAWQAADYGSPVRAEHPQLVWSGDGGSVGLGWVYLSPELVSSLREGDRDAAITQYLNRYGSAVPARLLRTPAVAASGAVRRDIRSELDALPCSDPARSFYFFLLLNDQRRHLASNYEDIDLHRTEYQLPFFDWEFLSLAASVPVDAGLGHGFYTQWLAKFPDAVTAVPWQTYPGHVASSIKIPVGLGNQWDPRLLATQRRRFHGKFAREALTTLFADPFPSQIVRRTTLAAVTTIHGLHVRNYEYIIHAAAMYSRYWRDGGQTHSTTVALRDS